MPRYKIFDRDGDKYIGTLAETAKTVGMIGPYEVRKMRAIGDKVMCYFVVCPQKMRRKESWNYSRYNVLPDGNIQPEDDDVPLDPYHMCLLYELHEELSNEGEKI